MKDISLIAQQRLERMRFDGAIKCSVTSWDTVFGFFRVPDEGLVEVAVGAGSWPNHLYHIVTDEMTWHGPHYPSDKELSGVILSAETFSVYNRRKWTPGKGGSLLVRTAVFDCRDIRARLAFKCVPFGDYWPAVEKYYPELLGQAS